MYLLNLITIASKNRKEKLVEDLCKIYAPHTYDTYADATVPVVLQSPKDLGGRSICKILLRCPLGKQALELLWK